MSGDREVNEDILLGCLDAAVPLLLHRARAFGYEHLRREAAEAGDIIACGYDVLVRADSGWKPRDTDPPPHLLTKEQADAGVFARSYRPAELFNAVAKVIAIGALHPGGVTWLGRHWCVTPHKGCPRQPPAVAAEAREAS